MTRSDDHLSALVEDHRHRSHMTSALADLDRQIDSIVNSMASPLEGSGFTPEQFAQVLTDAELIGFDAWTQGSSDVLGAEIRRRAAERQKQARTLGAYRGDAELITLLAERLSTSS
jgi:hypothetical protein